jgi:hypothetical protein
VCICRLSIFPRLVIKNKIFGKKSVNIKYVFLFSLQLLCETFFIIRTIGRDMINDVYWPLCKEPVIGLYAKNPLFSSDFNDLEFSRQVFEKYSNTKFHKNPSRRTPVVPCGRTDRQTDRPTDRYDQANSRFRNVENAPKNDTKTILRSVVASIPLQNCMKICIVKCYGRTCIHKRIQMRGTYYFL